MHQHKPSDELKPPKAPGFFPFDKDGNMICDRPTTDADWEKYWKRLERYKKKLKKLSERDTDQGQNE